MALGPELVINGTFNTDISGWGGESSGGTANWDANAGDGRLQLDNAGAPQSFIRQNIVTEIGKTYRISGDIVLGTGSVYCALYTAVTSYISTSVDGTVTEDFIATGISTAFRCYTDGDPSTGYFDNLSIREVLPVTTTTVEIEWIDSISAAATGNKIYRDDVEIADIANGVQIYQDATAEIGTEYKYEVQAYSATDETTQEVLGVNVQYITTA